MCHLLSSGLWPPPLPFLVCVQKVIDTRKYDLTHLTHSLVYSSAPQFRWNQEPWQTQNNWAGRLAIHQILSFAPKAHREMTFSSLLFGRGCSFQFTHSVVSNSLQPHELQHARPPCPSPTPGAYSNSCSLSQQCHPTTSSSVIPFSCLQSFPASGSFPVHQFFTSGGQSIGVSASASVLPMNIQD